MTNKQFELEIHVLQQGKSHPRLEYEKGNFYQKSSF